MCIYIGSEPVIAYKNNIQSLGHKRMQLDDCLEFNVASPSEQYENGLSRTINITAPSYKPILCELGDLGKYLQNKMNLPIYQNELPEYDIENYNKGTILNGVITNTVEYRFKTWGALENSLGFDGLNLDELLNSIGS